MNTILKKGAKSAVGNYRPVSLTSVCCKILESIIRDNLGVDHLLEKDLLHQSQHGFITCKSCTTNLLEFLELLTSAGDSLDVIFLDFAKAFDKVPVPHKRLVAQLQAHGVGG